MSLKVKTCLFRITTKIVKTKFKFKTDLYENKSLNEYSYEWLRVLKYRCEKSSTIKKDLEKESQEKSKSNFLTRNEKF